MAQIQVIRDPEIVQSDIIHYLESEKVEGTDTFINNQTDVNQTDVYGVLMPILALNNVAVGYRELIRFELDMLGRTPAVYFKFKDIRGVFSAYVDAGNDNELRVQILPPVENTYKKINFTFFVTDISINNGIVEGKAIYKLAKFTQTNFEALGKKTTYEICDHISLQTGLGFASNVEVTNDSRYMECRYKSYKDLLGSEIEKSVSDMYQVYDWWVDQNNYLTLCNIYDRVTSEDSDEEMKIWSTTNYDDPTTGNKKDTHLVPCILTNHPDFATTDLAVTDFEIISNPVTHGNARIVSVFYEGKKDWTDNYIGDGDIKRDEFMEFEYGGEVYGDYDYLFAEQSRNLFLNKLKSETIVIKMKTPMLGLNRGSQVKFVWYNNSSSKQYLQNKVETTDVGALTTEDIFVRYPKLAWLADFIISGKNADTFPMVLDMQYSGQYTVLGQYIIYENTSWYCELHCVRPKSLKPEIFPVFDNETGEPIN